MSALCAGGGCTPRRLLRQRAQLLQLEAQNGLSPSAILVDASFGSGDPAVLTVGKQEVVTLLSIRRLIATAANTLNQLAATRTPRERSRTRRRLPCRKHGRDSADRVNDVRAEAVTPNITKVPRTIALTTAVGLSSSSDPRRRRQRSPGRGSGTGRRESRQRLRLVGRFPGVDVKTTLKTWTVMETTIGVMSFAIAACIFAIAACIFAYAFIG